MSYSALIIYYPEKFFVFFTRGKFGGFYKQTRLYMGIITKNCYGVVMKKIGLEILQLKEKSRYRGA
jgi:hypothetical protein